MLAMNWILKIFIVPVTTAHTQKIYSQYMCKICMLKTKNTDQRNQRST